MRWISNTDVKRDGDIISFVQNLIDIIVTLVRFNDYIVEVWSLGTFILTEIS